MLHNTCILCDRPIGNSSLCEIHFLAYQKLNKSKKEWLEAFNDKLTMEDFLKKIASLRDTGIEVKQVAKQLLRNGLKT